MWKNKGFRRVDWQASLICCFLVIVACVVVGAANYNTTYNHTIASLQDRTDAIYKSTNELLSEELFEQLNTIEDMDTELYKEYQQRLLELREVANVRYLYTAKKDNDGNYIYVIDGLPLDSDDFRGPGALIEDEILYDINETYNGNITLPDKILDTSWGRIFLAYYPIYDTIDDSGDIIGVVGIEIDAEEQFATYTDIMRHTPTIILIFCIATFFIYKAVFKQIANPKRKDIYTMDGLTKLNNRSSFELDMQNLYSKGKNIGIIIIDLDNLKMINDNLGHLVGDEYIKIAANSLVETVDGRGVVYRIGGDEFAIVVRMTNEEKVIKGIEEVHKNFAKALEKSNIVGSMSLGYAVFNKFVDEGNIYHTMKRADDMMYNKKRSKKV